MSAVIRLIGCVEKKAATSRPARELYTSPLFQGRRAFAETFRHRTRFGGRGEDTIRAAPWFILSAYWGIVHPDRTIMPYKRSVRDLSEHDLSRMQHIIVQQALTLPPATIELHAGKSYLKLLDLLDPAEFTVELWPGAGKPIGLQLQWYKQQAVGG